MPINRQKLSPYESGNALPGVQVDNVVEHIIDQRSGRLSVPNQADQNEVTDEVVRGLVDAGAIEQIEAAFVFRAFGTVQYYLTSRGVEPNEGAVRGVDELNQRLLGFCDEFGPDGVVAVERTEHSRGYSTAHVALLGSLANIIGKPDAPYLVITGVGGAPTLKSADSRRVSLDQAALSFEPAGFSLNSQGVFIPEAGSPFIKSHIAAEPWVAHGTQLPL
jgi:hypothetical protein